MADNIRATWTQDDYDLELDRLEFLISCDVMTQYQYEIIKLLLQKEINQRFFKGTDDEQAV